MDPSLICCCCCCCVFKVGVGSKIVLDLARKSASAKKPENFNEKMKKEKNEGKIDGKILQDQMRYDKVESGGVDCDGGGDGGGGDG
jgi:hypothetical protein